MKQISPLPSKTYQEYREAFKGVAKPFAFVDLDYFDENVRNILKRAGNKKIRIASKSIRCVALMQRILSYSPQYQGIMSYCADETVFLSQAGLDDFLIGYPIWDKNQLLALGEEIKKGKKITLMIDSQAHIKQIGQIGQQYQIPFRLCIDLDMSSDFWGGIHFGVFRSPVQSPSQILALIQEIKKYDSLQLVGLMGYEAQIAGLGTKSGDLKSRMIQFLKKKSIREIAIRRTEAVKQILQEMPDLEIVNGGGTGSLESTIQEELITEVTVGSGFYCSGLFDNYLEFNHLPAVAYAIEITRKPKKHIFTCAGGGYVASGAIGKEKLPKPYLPLGFKLIDNEGVGEVQTPISYEGSIELNYGDPIFLRHAKAGEICERFKEFYVIENGKLQNQTLLTYRGEGKCFV
jgi:D-serine deaminase-like pyridoxal phosphate-dependent protein